MPAPSAPTATTTVHCTHRHTLVTSHPHIINIYIGMMAQVNQQLRVAVRYEGGFQHRGGGRRAAPSPNLLGKSPTPAGTHLARTDAAFAAGEPTRQKLRAVALLPTCSTVRHVTMCLMTMDGTPPHRHAAAAALRPSRPRSANTVPFAILPCPHRLGAPRSCRYFSENLPDEDGITYALESMDNNHYIYNNMNMLKPRLNEAQDLFPPTRFGCSVSTQHHNCTFHLGYQTTRTSGTEYPWPVGNHTVESITHRRKIELSLLTWAPTPKYTSLALDYLPWVPIPKKTSPVLDNLHVPLWTSHPLEDNRPITAWSTKQVHDTLEGNYSPKSKGVGALWLLPTLMLCALCVRKSAVSVRSRQWWTTHDSDRGTTNGMPASRSRPQTPRRGLLRGGASPANPSSPSGDVSRPPTEATNRQRAIQEWMRSSPPSCQHNKGRGDCLFRAIAQALEGTTQAMDHLTLRWHTARHMTEHATAWEPFWNGESPAPPGLELPCDSFQEYIRIIANPGQWGGGLELGVLADLLKSTILILGPDLHAIYGSGSPRICLKLAAGHYERVTSVVPTWIWDRDAPPPRLPPQDLSHPQSTTAAHIETMDLDGLPRGQEPLRSNMAPHDELSPTQSFYGGPSQPPSQSYEVTSDMAIHDLRPIEDNPYWTQAPLAAGVRLQH